MLAFEPELSNERFEVLNMKVVDGSQPGKFSRCNKLLYLRLIIDIRKYLLVFIIFLWLTYTYFISAFCPESN